MVGHLSTGTATIVALMAAHRLAQDQVHATHAGRLLQAGTARIDGCPHTPDRLGDHGEQATKRRTTIVAITSAAT